MPIGAIGSRTAVNDQMGGRTQVSGLLAAGVVALVLLFLTAPMEYLPTATLGAVIVTASIGLIDLNDWRGLSRVSKVEVAMAAITMIGVIAIGVLQALLLPVALTPVGWSSTGRHGGLIISTFLTLLFVNVLGLGTLASVGSAVSSSVFVLVAIAAFRSTPT